MKKIAQSFSKNFIIRFYVRLLLFFIRQFSRIISILKYKALVKESLDSICHYSTEIKYGNNIKVGNNTRIGPNCTLGGYGGIIIGKNVVISSFVIIETAGLILEDGPPYNKHFGKKIIIEDGVWIGSNSIILNNVTIGENSIIGAGTVITKDIPRNSIIVGSLNRQIK
tara:strand:- start:272 stop:775 length:504 start_codon:yes stop_codon:yes gene_type:complete